MLQHGSSANARSEVPQHDVAVDGAADGVVTLVWLHTDSPNWPGMSFQHLQALPGTQFPVLDFLVCRTSQDASVAPIDRDGADRTFMDVWKNPLTASPRKVPKSHRLIVGNCQNMLGLEVSVQGADDACVALEGGQPHAILHVPIHHCVVCRTAHRPMMLPIDGQARDLHLMSSEDTVAVPGTQIPESESCIAGSRQHPWSGPWEHLRSFFHLPWFQHLLFLL
mmetsp:Transcript_62075/g.131126  ORF Transcript_62075/g.131126 Transcript_62075/m.131126 type:complete len:223 (+) Transcript_62075:608-1276(+)